MNGNTATLRKTPSIRDSDGSLIIRFSIKYLLELKNYRDFGKRFIVLLCSANYYPLLRISSKMFTIKYKVDKNIRRMAPNHKTVIALSHVLDVKYL